MRLLCTAKGDYKANKRVMPCVIRLFGPELRLSMK